MRNNKKLKLKKNRINNMNNGKKTKEKNQTKLAQKLKKQIN